jgi:hypothetical protein
MRDWAPGTGRWVLGLAGLVLLVGVATIVQGTASIVRAPTDSDLLVYFLPAAERIADGHPFEIYDIQNPNGARITLPPLSMFWMALPLVVGRALDVADVVSCLSADFGTLDCRTLVWMTGLAFLPFVLLLGALAAGAARALNPRLGRDELLFVAALVVFSPLLWLTFTMWWHPEQVLMLALLVGGAWQLQRRRGVLAGVLFGLAMLTRLTAVGPIAVLGVLLLTDRSWRLLAQVVVAAAAVFGLGMLPYLLVDPSNTVEALLVSNGQFPVTNSIWSFVRSTVIGDVVQSFDRALVVGLTIVITFLAARWRGITAMGSGAWALMAISLMLVVLFGKRTWPYYYAEPFVFLVVWEVAARSGHGLRAWGWPALSVLYLVIAATLAQYMGLPSISEGGLVLRLMAVVQFVGIGVVAIAVWRALRSDAATSAAPDTPEVAPAATV